MGLRVWLWLAVAQSVWAGSYVAMKFAGDELPIGAVVTLRYLVAAILFLPLIVRRGLPRYERRDWWLILLLGALNFGVSPSLQVASLRYTQAVDVSILVALEPLITILLACLWLREPLPPRTLSAGVLSLAGALILSGVGAPGAGFTTDRLIGNGLYLTATLFEVSVTIAGARLAKQYDPLATMGLLKTAGLLACGVAYAGVWDDIDVAAVSDRAWWSVLYLGAGASLFSYGVWYWLVRTVAVQKLALSLFLQPIAGTAAGVMIAGETAGVNTLLGAILILAGIGWQEARRGKALEPLDH